METHCGPPSALLRPSTETPCSNHGSPLQPDFSILDHSALTEICGHLDAKSLVALQQVLVGLRKAATEDEPWRNACVRDFPYNFSNHMQPSRSSPLVPWHLEYGRRAHIENCWRTGTCNNGQNPVYLQHHSGPIFGGIQFRTPGIENMFLTGSINMEIRGAEFHLYEFDPPKGKEILSAPRSMRHVPNLYVDPILKASGVFCFGKPGSTTHSDFVCGTFGPDLYIARLEKMNSHEYQQQRTNNGNGDSGSASTSEDSYDSVDTKGRIPISGVSDSTKDSDYDDEESRRRSKRTKISTTPRMMSRSTSPSDGGNHDTADDDDILNAAWDECSKYHLRPVYSLIGHTNATTFARSTESKVITASFDGTLKIFTLPSSATATNSTPNERNNNNSKPNNDPIPIYADATFQDDQIQNNNNGPNAAANNNNYYYNNAAIPTTPVCGVDIDKDWQRICSGGNDMQLKVWDTDSKRILQRIDGHQGWIWNIISEDDAMNNVLTSCTDGFVRAWDLRAGVLSGSVNLNQDYHDKVYPVGGIARRGDGKYIVAGSFDSNVYVIDRRMFKTMYTLSGHRQRVARATIDGDTIISFGFDGAVCKWEFV